MTDESSETGSYCWAMLGLIQMAGLEEHEAATEGWIYQNCKDFGAGGILGRVVFWPRKLIEQNEASQPRLCA